VPLLVLILVALTVGCATVLVVRRWTERVGAMRRPVAAAAQAAGEVVAEHPRLRPRLGARFNPQTATGLALSVALVLALGGGLLLGVLAFVVRADPNLLGIDASVAAWGHRHATTFSTHGLNAITQLGTTITILVVGTGVVLVDYCRTHSLGAVPFLLLVVAGEKLLTTTIKDLADRVRPSLNPVAATLGPSFPSGHSASAAAFFAAAALLLGRHQGPRGRAVLAGLAVGIAVAVATSRVMLDVHWLTDVIAGLALGWAWFAVSAIAFGGRLLHFGASAEIAADAADTEHRGPPATAAAG
jgi:undecaprenyl-diphosphatase